MATKTSTAEKTAARKFATALAAEHRIVGALPDKGATRAQIDRAWRAADRTNAAMRVLSAIRDGAE